MSKTEYDLATEINRMNRELKDIRALFSDFVNFMREAEQEVPEFMRRFMNYAHDLHDIKFMHEELGLSAPTYLMREVERVDDRLRQLLVKLHTDGGAFEKVRREMAADPLNRYDHTRLLFAPIKENINETGKVEQRGVSTEDGTDTESPEPSGDSSAGHRSARQSRGHGPSHRRGRV
jgi:hypothetical protein